MSGLQTGEQLTWQTKGFVSMIAVAAGKDGAPGADSTVPGPANTLTVGTITKGTNPSATITGTPPNQILNLVLPQGDTGATGAPGPTGPASLNWRGVWDAGTTYAELDAIYYDGSSYYALSTTTGDVPVPGVDGDPWQELAIMGQKGDKGDTGATGADSIVPGPANTLTVGTVTTGAPGSSASVTITGDAPDQTLSMSIPRGDKGDTGTAATIAVGAVTTGAAGSSATVDNTGTASAAVLTMSIPRGDTGATGPVNVLSKGTVTTGVPGSEADFTITGTAPAQTLSMTIPQGPQGTPGVDGVDAYPIIKLAAGDAVPTGLAVGTLILRTAT